MSEVEGGGGGGNLKMLVLSFTWGEPIYTQYNC